VIDTANLRQLISLDGNGTTFRGTYHRVPDDRDPSQAEVNVKSSLGIFFLNSLCAVVFTNVDNKVFRDPVRHFNPVHDAPHRIVMASQIADLLR
jgi:hypothetical protein